MQIRFLRRVGIRGGPFYLPGEVTDMPEADAQWLLARGWATIPEPPVAMPPVPVTEVEAPKAKVRGR